MNKRESNIICELNLNDFKYLSVRSLFFNWFFTVGGEIANQLLDNTIKLYLKSINRFDIIKEIRDWRGNESYNISRIIKLCIEKLTLDFDFDNCESILDTIYKTYQVRYLEDLKKVGEIRGFLKDLYIVDYTYKYFRDKINVSKEAKNETLINKIFLQGKDLLWGEDKISLFAIFNRNNKAFK